MTFNAGKDDPNRDPEMIPLLKLKPSRPLPLAILVHLWPTGMSSAVSNLFIAIVWVNHHHLLRRADRAIPYLI